jgi:hypothetical protein
MEKNKYIIDRFKLEPCDIILTSDTTFSSKGIRLATLGKYSHAAIYVDGTVIEATLKGVFSKNTQRMIFDQENQVAVFRSKRPLSEQEAIEICQYARAQTGSLYALPEAITIRARSILAMPETRKQFCSRLVAKSYEAAGYDLANLRNPAYCTPKQIGLCKSFYQVQNIIKQATKEDIAFAETPDPIAENQRHTFEWLNKVRDLVEGDSSITAIDIQTIGDVNNFLLKYPQYDAKVSTFMEDTNYLHYYNFDTKINPHRYHEQLFQTVMKMHPDALAFIKSHLELVDMHPYDQNLKHYIFYMKQQKLRFFSLHIQLYVNLITGIYQRLTVMIAGCESIGEDEFGRKLRKDRQAVLELIKMGEMELKRY